jgi:hypothetical protein
VESGLNLTLDWYVSSLGGETIPRPEFGRRVRRRSGSGQLANDDATREEALLQGTSPSAAIPSGDALARVSGVE